MWFELNVLGCVSPLDKPVVVEGDLHLASSGVLAKDIDTFLFREILESARRGNGVENRCSRQERIRSRLDDLPEYIDFLAVNLLDNYRDFGIGNVRLKSGSNILFKLRGSPSCRLHVSYQR